MKLSSKILIVLVILAAASMILSNYLLKREYDTLDKSDIYWSYEKVSQQPFRHLLIKGGNTTKIAFEPSSTCSVRILHAWARYHNGSLSPIIRNDTLIIDFDFVPQNTFEKYWMRGTTTVRIFAPELLSINGVDTNLEMFKMKQKKFAIQLAGRSTFEVESLIKDLDSLDISERDSSEVVFEMSPEYKEVRQEYVSEKSGNDNGDQPKVNGATEIKSKEAITLKVLSAKIQGNSVLDIGHAQISSLQLNISDSSAILISGGALRRLK